MQMRWLAVAWLAGAALALAQDSPPTPVGPKTAVEPYQLGADDQIVIRASSLPDINEKPIRLDRNGNINMPMIGRVHAAGLTTEQLEGQLNQKLKFYLEDPDVAVNIVELHTDPVSVIGEVGTPGVQQIHGDKTLVEVLSMAGGPRPEAGPTVKITRRLEWGRVPLPGAVDDPTGKFSLAEVNLKALVAAKDPQANILVRPDDVISVPKAEILYIYLVGDVSKTGPVVLTDGQPMPILQAISMSGGLLHTALARDAKILRPIMGGPRRAELPVDVKRILDGKANDIPLLPGDILLVPSNTARSAGIRGLEAALQVATMAATYSVIK